MQAEPRKNRAPSVLLPYQQRWVADVSPVKVAEKSRRIGWTWATAAESALLAASSNGMDVFYVGYKKEMAQEFVGDCADWAKHFGHAASAVSEEVLKDGDKDIKTYVIRFASGFKIVALSSRPSNLRGMQGYAVLDEAAFHDQLAELLKAALAFLMWGGRVAIISTHDGVENAFNELVEAVKAKRKPYSLHRTTLDDALADGLFRRICLVRGMDWSAEAEAAWRDELFAQYGEDADEELLCIPKRSGTTYFSRTLIEDRMVDAPVLRLELDDAFAQLDDDTRAHHTIEWCGRELLPLLEDLPADLSHCFGEDFGRTADLTIIAPATIGKDLVRRVPFLVELRNVPFRQQEQVLFFVVDRLPRFLAGKLDAGGNGQYLAEVAAQRYGDDRIEQVHLSDKWYGEHFPVYRAACEDATVELPRDSEVLDDHRLVRLINGIPKLPATKTKGKAGTRHGDSAVALCLMYAASRTDVEEYEFHRVRPGPGKRGDTVDRPVRVTAGFRNLGGVL